jgi:hypothetical protein
VFRTARTVPVNSSQFQPSSWWSGLVFGVAAVAYAALLRDAWLGRLGLPALAWLAAATTAFALGRRSLSGASRRRADFLAKLLFTAVGLVALLRHPIEAGDGARLPIYAAIVQYLPQVDGRAFALFGGLAVVIKACGVLASAFGWHLLLVGQGIRFPFWQAILTAFLIGRFVGTFLPSTLGLDGYTLYEAGRYSNRWSRAATAKLLEKLIGITGLFVGMVLTLPFGYAVLVDVARQLGRPQAAALLAGVIGLAAGGVCIAVMLLLVHPGLLTRLAEQCGRALPAAMRAGVAAVTEAVGAYRGKTGLLFAALVSKFITHFTTAVVYYCTALAIGVVGARFWPIVFGSTIQILGTLLAPTIAGEGAREAFQALLLSTQLGGVAQAVLSAALGFAAAEAATLWGGAFLLVRTPTWRPRFARVDGRQVDYAWIEAETQRAGRASLPERR